MRTKGTGAAINEKLQPSGESAATSAGNNQTRAFERGKTFSYYVKQVGKKLIHPAKEHRRKVARTRDQ